MKPRRLMTRRDSLGWLSLAATAPGLLLGGCGGGGDSGTTAGSTVSDTVGDSGGNPGGGSGGGAGGGTGGEVGGNASVASFAHGDQITIEGAFGQTDVTQTFLGGANGMIESCQAGAEIADGNGWYFNELGHRTRVMADAKRDKVLFTPEDRDHYNATRHFDPGFAIAEQRYFYKAHWVRSVLLLEGQPYLKSFQWKHERVNWRNTIVDGDCEIKVHDYPNGGGGLMTFVNRSASDKSVYWGGQVIKANSDWALLEIMVYTGSQGANDGKVVTRAHVNGRTYVNQNRQTERVYADPTMRLRHFIEQNYFGNFGQVEDGVNNPLPKPDVRELWSDDSRVIVGNDARSGWQRVELRDAVSLRDATVRELQAWTSWDDNITLTLNTGGLPAGTHDLFLVVIDGVDAQGWDVVTHSRAIRVVV